jgi:hypothetical protein
MQDSGDELRRMHLPRADLTQLLRVPGTLNRKYEESPVVRIQDLEESRTYSAGDLDRTLPPLPEPAPTNGHTHHIDPGDPPVELGYHPKSTSRHS